MWGGGVVATEKGGSVTTFPFMVNDPKGPRRTQEKCNMEAQQAIRDFFMQKAKGTSTSRKTSW